jgi:hypothetical protein
MRIEFRTLRFTDGTHWTRGVGLYPSETIEPWKRIMRQLYPTIARITTSTGAERSEYYNWQLNNLMWPAPMAHGTYFNSTI